MQNTINMKKAIVFIFCVILFFTGCKSTAPVVTTTPNDGLITFKFIQVNDVYEIAPLAGGQYGGMARVAHISDSIKKVAPNSFLVMAGDFLNPSLLGALTYNGERIRGKQMIEVMNAMDFDLVTFGNHEFDLDEEVLQQRLNEANFQWISSNTFHKKDKEAVPFTTKKGPVPFTYTFAIQDKDGTEARVGMFSVTIDANPQDFVFYGNYKEYAEKAVKTFADNTVIVGLTHLELEQDKELAKNFTTVPLIMGGHEHDNMLVPVNNTLIAKADANAKTVYVHTLTYNTQSKETKVASELIKVTDKIPSKPEVETIVEKWNTILQKELSQVIKNPNEIIFFANPPLEGRDAFGRNQQTNLGALITTAMAQSFEEPVLGALVNSGSFRIDDVLENEVSSVDIFRVLPFGGEVVKVTLKGNLLVKILEYGNAAKGTGAYLQRYNIQYSDIAGWLLNGQPIRTTETYTIAVSDFLLMGYDIPFLTPAHPDVIKVTPATQTEAAKDIRKAVINYLKIRNK